MKTKLLLALAEHLKTVKPEDYTITSYAKDALFHATHVPEIKKAGLRMLDRANEPGGPIAEYKGATDIAAACRLFEIDDIQAQYLFGGTEIDIRGTRRKSPCVSKRDGGSSRDTEWPTWTAARIECFVRDPSVDYLAPAKKAA